MPAQDITIIFIALFALAIFQLLLVTSLGKLDRHLKALANMILDLTQTQKTRAASVDKLETEALAKTVEDLVSRQTKDQISKMLAAFEESLTKITTSSEQKALDAYDTQIARAKSEIAAYKKSQFAALDDNIVSLVQKTTQEILGKKLSEDDQMSLIYDALEKAKAEKLMS